MNLSIHRFLFSAEAGGFEPPVRLPVRQFSKLVVSATHPHFQGCLVELNRFSSKAVQRYNKYLNTQNFFIKIFSLSLYLIR